MEYKVLKKPKIKDVLDFLNENELTIAPVAVSDKIALISRSGISNLIAKGGITNDDVIANLDNIGYELLEYGKSINLDDQHIYHRGDVLEVIFNDKIVVGKKNHDDWILVIGGAGYIGYQLVKTLLDEEKKVRVFDNLLYANYVFEEFEQNKNFEFVKGDMLNIAEILPCFVDVKAVVLLAAIVGDPASKLDVDLTIKTNVIATSMISSICKYLKIERFVFASTCSVYGKDISKNDKKSLLNENDKLNPISLYANSKIESEKVLLDLKDKNFKPTILRFSTIYGLSKRMRFDLVVNIMTAHAIKKSKIKVFGGEQYRPLLHVKDAARAIASILELPLKIVAGEIFNVGSSSQNYSIMDIAKFIKNKVPETSIEVDSNNTDERDYKVDFTKLNKVIPNLISIDLEAGVEELKNYLLDNKIDFEDRKYNNYKFLKGI